MRRRERVVREERSGEEKRGVVRKREGVVRRREEWRGEEREW